MSYSCYIGQTPHWISCEGVRSKILLCVSTGVLLGEGWERWSLHIYMVLYEIHRSWTIKVPLVQHKERLATHSKGFEGLSSAANASVILVVTLTAFIAQDHLGNGCLPGFQTLHSLEV